MNHFIHQTLPLIEFGLGGILLMILVKVNDLNHLPENDLLTWRQVISKFFRKEWASYFASITLVVISACSHDEWLIWFTSGKLSELTSGIPLGVKLAMTLWGMIGHYLLYKWLSKFK